MRQLGEKPAEAAVTENVVGKARESVLNLLRKKYWRQLPEHARQGRLLR